MKLAAALCCALLLALQWGCGEARQTPSSASLETRLESILLEPDPAQRAGRLLAFLEPLSADAVPAMRSVFMRRWHYVGALEAVLVADWWADRDPESALESIRTGAFGDHAELALAAAVRRYARSDPEAARDLLFERGRGFPQEVALLSLVRGWAESGVDGVVDFVERFPQGVARQSALEVLADHMVIHQGPEAAARFVEALPDAGKDRFKLQFTRRMAAALVLGDPEFAAAWAQRQVSSEFGEGVYRHVVGRWAHFDGEAALDWLAGLPADDAQEEAIELGYSMWLRRDPERADAWAGAQPQTDALEPVRAMYAVRLAQRDVDAALALLPTIADGERRNRATFQIGRQWLEADRIAALRWLEQAKLDPALRERMLEPPRPRRAERRRGRAVSDARRAVRELGDEVREALDGER